jgi:hypothetical protein
MEKGKGAKLREGEKAKLGEGYLNVWLSQDRIFPPHLAYYEGERLS